MLHVGPRNSHHTYTMRDVPLENTVEERDLGVFVDGSLKFRKQAASAAAKGTQILAVILLRSWTNICRYGCRPFADICCSQRISTEATKWHMYQTPL